MKNSHIEWTDHTFNPWEGCTKVSPGCAHCYAETRNARFGGGTAPNWGPGAPRRRTSVQNWNQPIHWARVAEQGWFRELYDAEGKTVIYRGDMRSKECPEFAQERKCIAVRPRVFCASLADVGDMEVPIEWFADLLSLIFECQTLDWQLLTKRPETFRERLMHAALYMAGYRDGQASENPTAKQMAGWEWVHDWAVKAKPPANVWMGTTVEDQARADERIPHLLKIPARVWFLSCEPLLGPVDLSFGNPKHRTFESYHAEIHWVICGGESGPGARPMHPDWARSLRDQCAEAGVPFFFKQWGEWAPGCPSDSKTEMRVVSPGVLMGRFGKANTGRKLQGGEHSAFPEVLS